MNSCFIFPPGFDPSMPYIAPYLLKSYVESEVDGCNITILDLNVLFFNEIVPNPYLDFNKKLNIVESFNLIIENEKIINEKLTQFSKEIDVIIHRQNIKFGFNCSNSEDVKNFLDSESKYKDVIVKLFMKSINISKYAVFTFSITTYEQLIPSLIIAEYLKNKSSKIITILGGNIISRVFKGLMKSKLLINIDYIIKGEGEIALARILRHLYTGSKLINHSNLIFTNRPIISEFEPISKHDIVDITKLPMPNFDSVDFSKYYSPEKVIPITLTRGCSWGNCKFCGIYSGWEKDYRVRNINRTVDEIEEYINKYGIRLFRLVDESPLLDDIILFSKIIISRGMKISIESYFNIRNELEEDKIAQILSQAGFKQFFFGIESFDLDVLKEIDKELNNPENYNNILRNLYSHGISNYGFFLLGLPNDKIQNEQKLEKFIIESASLCTIAVASFIPLSNSPLFYDEQYQEKYKVEIIKRGDLTTRCDYLIENQDNTHKINLRVEKMIFRIFSERKDLYISSILPYESRFYLIDKFGSDFNKNLENKHIPFIEEIELSDELSKRASGLK